VFTFGTSAAMIPQRVEAAAPAGAQMLAPVLTKMEAAGRQLKTLQAAMSQLKHDTTLGFDETSTGTIYYKAGAAGSERVLIEYTQPTPQSVSVIGSKVVIYQPQINQAFVTTRQ